MENLKFDFYYEIAHPNQHHGYNKAVAILHRLKLEFMELYEFMMRRVDFGIFTWNLYKEEGESDCNSR